MLPSGAVRPSTATEERRCAFARCVDDGAAKPRAMTHGPVPMVVYIVPAFRARDPRLRSLRRLTVLEIVKAMLRLPYEEWRRAIGYLRYYDTARPRRHRRGRARHRRRRARRAAGARGAHGHLRGVTACATKFPPRHSSANALARDRTDLEVRHQPDTIPPVAVRTPNAAGAMSAPALPPTVDASAHASTEASDPSRRSRTRPPPRASKVASRAV
jgi:hypothetical protein